MHSTDRKGFRRFLPLLLLAFVLVLAAAFVLLLPLIQKEYPAKGKQTNVYVPTYQTVAQLDSTTLKTITVKHTDGESYTLVYQDRILSLQTDSGTLEAISATLSDQFIKYVTTIYVEDTIAADVSEVREELPDMGLNPPQIEVTAVFTDGREITIALGSTMLDTTYHYYQWSGDQSVYLCNTGVYQTFEHTADMLRTVEQPTIVPSLVERVSIQHGDAAPIRCALKTDAEGMVRGTLESPFTYPMDPNKAQALLTAVKNFSLGARLQPVTNETLSLYGFDTPLAVVTIDQRGGLYAQTDENGSFQSGTIEPSNIKLTLGDPNGAFVHYCAYEGTCYRVSSFLVSAFLDANAADYATRNPADMGNTALHSIVVETPNGTLDIQAEYLETVLPNNELETDENGHVIYTAHVTCNGASVTAEAFENLISRLQQMAVSGALDSAMRPGGTPRWQMTLTTVQGETRTLTGYMMDAFHSMLAVDGVALHYLNNEALEITLGEFSALLSPADTP